MAKLKLNVDGSKLPLTKFVDGGVPKERMTTSQNLVRSTRPGNIKISFSHSTQRFPR